MKRREGRSEPTRLRLHVQQWSTTNPVVERERELDWIGPACVTVCEAGCSQGRTDLGPTRVLPGLATERYQAGALAALLDASPNDAG